MALYGVTFNVYIFVGVICDGRDASYASDRLLLQEFLSCWRF
jgi:hypothetical protein